MLKSIVLKNFVHFKEKIVIVLNNSQKEQTEEQSPNSAKNTTSIESKASNDSQEEQTEKQSTNAAKNETPLESNASNASQKEQREEQLPNSAENATSSKDMHSNGLNIFVGANFCGKSTVIELIRRCMTDEINVSVTKSYDDRRMAYAFCKFDLPEHGEIISGIIKSATKKEMYKVLINKNCTLVRLKSLDNNTSESFSLKEQEGKQVMELILNQTSDEKEMEILAKFKKKEETEESSSNKPNWTCLEKIFIATFPLRGIGSVQWTKSKKIGEAHKVINYKMASERAEIISTLLSPEIHRECINEEMEVRIFDFLTYPEVFKFEKVDNQIKVKHNGSQFDLLKTSEGIIEAKVVSLLLAHKKIKTFCLEDPDRGMHPQMIERLRTVLYYRALHKTIIVVTHSPYFIDSITIHKTHVFFRNGLYDPYVCSVSNVGENSDLSRVADNETLRTLLFATKVLLVEGVTDRDVVQGILTQQKCAELERSENKNEIFLNENISTHQIIPIGGCDNIERVQAFCDYIDLPCLCLLDRDKVVRLCKGKTIFWGKRKDKKVIEQLEMKYKNNLAEPFSGYRPEHFENYIKELESRKKRSTSPREIKCLSEIIDFRRKGKREEDLKTYIELLGKKYGCPENISTLKGEELKKALEELKSNKKCSKQDLKKIEKFWKKIEDENEFEIYMNELQRDYSDMTPSKFLENHLLVFEKYLIKLESNRKTFVWRSGAIEDAILSSENSTIILELLVSTEQETTEGTTPYSEPPNPGNVDELNDIGNGSQELKKNPDNSLSPRDVLKLKLKERLDENTRKQFSIFLNDVWEVKNFLEFIARVDPKPDEMQYSESHESDNSPSGHEESKGSSVS